MGKFKITDEYDNMEICDSLDDLISFINSDIDDLMHNVKPYYIAKDGYAEDDYCAYINRMELKDKIRNYLKNINIEIVE